MMLARTRPALPLALAVIAVVAGTSLVVDESAPAASTSGAIPFIEPDQTFEVEMDAAPTSGAVGGDWATQRGPTQNEITLYHRDSAGHWSAHSSIPVPFTTPALRPVVIHGDLLLIGLPQSTSGGGGSVRVYALTVDGPVELAPIVNPTPSSPGFGARLAFDGVTLLVGRQSDGSTPLAFERQIDGTWSLLGQLPMPPLAVGTGFARSIRVDGSVAVLSDVEAESLTTPSLTVGRLHVYERHRDGQWTYAAGVSGFDSAPSISFGSSISVSDGVIVAGAPTWRGEDGQPRGAVFIVERDPRGTWNVIERIDAPTDIVDGRFGGSVVLRGKRLVVFSRPPYFLYPTPCQFTTFVRGARGEWVPGIRMAVPWPPPAYPSILGPGTASDGSTLLVVKRNGLSTGTLSFLNNAFDCDGSGVEDALEIEAGLVEDCNLNRRPDTCDAAAGRLNGDDDGVLDYCETDCNGNGIPDGEDLVAGVVGDCNGNGIPDSCEIAFKLATDHDGDGAPDDCQPDCNDNGVPDAFEIATGEAADCDGNGVPDTCGSMFSHGDFPVVYGYPYGPVPLGALFAARYHVEPGLELISKLVFAIPGLESPAGQFPDCLPNDVPVTIALCADDGTTEAPSMTVLWSTSFVTGAMQDGPCVYECRMPPMSPGAVGADFYVVIQMLKPAACPPGAPFVPMPIGICESESQPLCDGILYTQSVTATSPPFEEQVEAATWSQEPVGYIPYLHPFGVPCISAAADLTGDGIVDGADLTALFGAWGECAQTGQCASDLNTDGAVDGNDLAMVLGAWSQ